MGEISPVVRELNRSEAALLRRVRLEALAADPDAFGEAHEDAARLTAEAWERRLAREVVPGRKCVLVVEHDAEPVGICFAGIRDDDETTGYLAGMFVSRELRDRGLGKALLHAAEEWISRHGGHAVRAAVAVGNRPAIRFYRRAGYTVASEADEPCPGSPEAALRIDKRLSR